MQADHQLPLPFEFRATVDDGSDLAGFVLHVPAGLKSKSQLLHALAEHGRFPAYFGVNWDSLLDCLRDLDWIEQREVAVVHADLPLVDHPQACRIYLDVLRDAALDWSRCHDREAKTARPDHRLRVIFPDDLRSRISDLLASS